MGTPKNQMPGSVQKGGDDRVLNEFVGVMGKLRAVIEAENDFLSRGMPATLLDTTTLKGQLSQEYALRSSDLVGDAKGQILSDPALHDKLVRAGAELCALSEENRHLLTKALRATSRRVDAVMDAVRACEDAAAAGAEGLPPPTETP